jgi:hypothetical protein
LGKLEHCHKFDVTCEINTTTHVREPIVTMSAKIQLETYCVKLNGSKFKIIKSAMETTNLRCACQSGNQCGGSSAFLVESSAQTLPLPSLLTMSVLNCIKLSNIFWTQEIWDCE